MTAFHYKLITALALCLGFLALGLLFRRQESWREIPYRDAVLRQGCTKQQAIAKLGEPALKGVATRPYVHTIYASPDDDIWLYFTDWKRRRVVFTFADNAMILEDFYDENGNPL